MEASFWLDRWQAKQIGFHQPDVNPTLKRYFERLRLDDGARVFVPLCGKTLDIGWLLERGCRVTGVELSAIAVRELFEELGVLPAIETHGTLERYSASGIDVFVGDLFDLQQDRLGTVDAVYDRASLVALPADTRMRYARHITSVTGNAKQLLISYEYDQTVMDGPPFSVTADEVRSLYADTYALQQLVCADVPGGLKGQCPALERVWLMESRG
jgi:thiopurine S-methyltransferase